jgi:hypothetical protein
MTGHTAGMDPVSNIRAFVLHEVVHAVDDNARFSKTPQWQKAWKSDLTGGELSGYAGHNPMEGFAEFARIAWGGKVPLATLAQKYPEATRFFKEQRLWPDDARAKDAARVRLAAAKASGYVPGFRPGFFGRVARSVGLLRMSETETRQVDEACRWFEAYR